jgi:hypothetical protein
MARPPGTPSTSLCEHPLILEVALFLLEIMGILLLRFRPKKSSEIIPPVGVLSKMRNIRLLTSHYNGQADQLNSLNAIKDTYFE